MQFQKQPLTIHSAVQEERDNDSLSKQLWGYTFILGSLSHYTAGPRTLSMHNKYGGIQSSQLQN